MHPCSVTMTGMYAHTCPPPPAARSWPEILLQGSGATVIGSLVAALGLVLVWRLTRDGDRRRAREEQTSASIARVVEDCGSLPSGGYRSLFDVKSDLVVAVDRISRSLILFGVRERREHRDASLWAFAWSAQMKDLARKAGKVSTSGEFDEMMTTIEEGAGDITVALVDWTESNHASQMSLPSNAKESEGRK
jgi:hypothetical protein